ncbi:MAG: sigma 54-interacting transcriptional regulator [Deltaproteobacteria bacterium]|nr:sigma 54-interacting transcriptional regulator [Deltaproteobacteria bacterium]
MSKETPGPPRGGAVDPTIKAGGAQGRRSRGHLLVTGPQIFAVYDLPERGTIRIGRGETADVRIDDPLISREHAALHVADGIELEDLGSANGTRLGDRALEPHERVELRPGEAVGVGSALLIVERASIGSRPRRFWTHGYFESRLEEECARAQREGATFAIARIRAAATPAIRDAIAAGFRATDVLAEYAPGDFEVLLVSTELESALAITRQVSSLLQRSGAPHRSSVVAYPRDGRTPEALVAAASEGVREPQPAGGGTPPIVEDEAMRRLYSVVSRIALGTINVLILGETGVGKEIVAEAVHGASPRRDGSFVRLNCAALTESLAESELFGHEKGAFTGAVKAKPGLLVAADGGTLFLDEVGELTPALQAKLLRAIETRQVLAVGATEPRAVDVRFVAATNRDLEAEVARSAFRQDLYYRLPGFVLQVPPLRERPSEIELFARAFAREAAARIGQGEPAISEEARAMFARYSWPGNIRELRNVVERAVLLAAGGQITPEHLPLEKMGAPVGMRPVTIPPASDDPERDRVLAVLARCAGNQTRAAKELGISRGTLVARLEKYGVARPRK